MSEEEKDYSTGCGSVIFIILILGFIIAIVYDEPRISNKDLHKELLELRQEIQLLKNCPNKRGINELR